MTVRHSLRARAITHSGLSTLIGTRFYPIRLPETLTLPAARYQVVSSPPSLYRDHESGAPDRSVSRIQIDVLAGSSDRAAAVGDQVVQAFDGWASGTAVGWCRVTNRFEDYDSAFKRYREVVEIEIDHAI